jgi:uncharacterized protein (DUF1778 family)
MPDMTTNRDGEEPKATVSFSVRLTRKERDLLSRAAEKRGWSLTNLLKNAALEKAIHILNTSAPNRVDFRGTAEEIARQVFTPRSARSIDQHGQPQAVEVYGSLEDVYSNPFPDPTPQVEVSPWHMPPGFLAQIRDAARYGGTEFLDLIVQASEAIATRNEGNLLPDPIDPSSI